MVQNVQKQKSCTTKNWDSNSYQIYHVILNATFVKVQIMRKQYGFVVACTRVSRENAIFSKKKKEA